MYILYKTTTLSKTDAQKLNRLLKVDLAVGVSEQVYGLVGRECEPDVEYKDPKFSIDAHGFAICLGKMVQAMNDLFVYLKKTQDNYHVFNSVAFLKAIQWKTGFFDKNLCERLMRLLEKFRIK